MKVEVMLYVTNFNVCFKLVRMVMFLIPLLVFSQSETVQRMKSFVSGWQPTLMQHLWVDGCSQSHVLLHWAMNWRHPLSTRPWQGSPTWRRLISWSWRNDTGCWRDSHALESWTWRHWFHSSVPQFHCQFVQGCLELLMRTGTAILTSRKWHVEYQQLAEDRWQRDRSFVSRCLTLIGMEFCQKKNCNTWLMFCCLFVMKTSLQRNWQAILMGKLTHQQSWLTSGHMLVVMDWQLRSTLCGRWKILCQWTF